MKRVLVGGYYGYGNIGDEAILEAFIRSCAPYPEIQVNVLSSNRKYTYDTHGVYSYSRSNPISVINGMLNSNLFISGGGGLIQDSTSRRSPYFYLSQLILAQILARKIYIMGQGIGPLSSSFARALMAELFASAHAVVVRDYSSQALLMNLLPAGKEILLGADLALLLEPASEETVDDVLYEEGASDLPDPLLVAVLKGKKKDTKTARYFSDAINTYLEQEGGSVLLVPFFPDFDRSFNEIVLSGIKGPKAILRKSHKPSDILALFKSAQHVLAGRYHAMIFASVANVPFTSIIYDPKMKLFLNELGIDSYVMSPIIGSKSIEECLLNDVENADVIKEKVAKRLPSLKERAGINITKLIELLEV